MLLFALGVQDPSNLNAISFSTQGKPQLPPHVPIQIHVAYKGVNIRRTVVDEGDNKKTKKVKFPCKLCGESHLTHLCPNISEAKRLLGQPNVAQQMVVLSNPFLHPN